MASSDSLQPVARLGMMRQKVPELLEEPTLLDDGSYSLHPLQAGDSIYGEICVDFETAGVHVKKVERLSNPHLWKHYAMERERLPQRKPEDPTFSLNERYLYHGSRAEKDFICEEGFDLRLAKQGCFGKGIYFSDSPKKCVKYSQREASADIIILLARVILGHSKVYGPGEKDRSLVREPEKPYPHLGWKYYDSVEGCPVNHREYVLYDGRRVLAEYIITCSTRTNSVCSNLSQQSHSDVQGASMQQSHSSESLSSDSDDSDSSDDGIARNQASRRAQEVLEGEKTQVVQCDACDEVRRLHTFCSTCELWLCQVCTKSHKKVSSTSSHSLSTDMEVNKRCVEIASEEEEKVKRLQEEIKQKLTCLTDSIQKIHSDVDDAKQKIKSAAEEARQVINMKEKTLLQELSRFEEEKLQSQTAMYESVKGIDVNIYNILQVINEVKESSSGRENQGKLAIVKAFLTNTESNPYLHVLVEKCIPVYFNCSNFLVDLNNMDMGYLHGVQGNINTRHLIDRPVHVQEITSQGMGGRVLSLAYSTFTNKLLAVVVVEGFARTVTVINPDSGECKPFLSPLSKRRMVDPLCVAYSEDGRRLFVIEKERGKRVITSYTHDGMFHSIITSSLKCPMGLAVYGGRIFVCDLNDKCVYILSMSGEVIKELKETPDHKALFTQPCYISVGGNGRFAVSDNPDRVHIFDKDYTLLYTYVTDIAYPCLTDVQVLPDGSVVVCDRNNGLHYISPDFSKTGLMNIGNISSLKPTSITIREKSHTIYIGSVKGKLYSIKY